MERAIEKGATYIDKLCHKFYDEQKGHGKKSDYVCRICGGPLETYYCEDRLYLVRCADCGTLALVKTANPGDAARVTLARPTLTPPNEPLTIEQLREMDGESVYVPKTNCWVLVTKNPFVPLFTWPDGEQCSAYDWYEQVGPVYRRPPERQGDTP